MRVASLLRLSTKKQAKKQAKGELDVPAQRKEIETFLSTKPGWTLVQEFVEAGVSAYSNTAEDRDILQGVLHAAKARKFDVLLMWKGDRLSRQVDELPTIVKRIIGWGVEVWSVADAAGGKQWTASNAMELLMLALEGFRNQSYSEAISVNVKTRMRQLVEEGQWFGGRVAFGYSLVPMPDEHGNPVTKGSRIIRHLAPNPETRPFVQEMYRKYLKGEGDAKIAAWLNSLGVPTLFNAKWTQAQVRTVLTNPLYKGLLVYKSGLGLSAPGKHQPIVDEATWNAVQNTRLAKAKLPIRQRNSTFPLSGVLRCAACAGRMGGHTNRTKLKSRIWERRYYTCLNYIHSRSCTAAYIRSDDVEAAFLEGLVSLFEFDGLRTLAEQRQNTWGQEIESARQEKRAAEEQIVVIDQALKRLDRAYLEAGTIDDIEYAEKKAMYKGQRRASEETLTKPLPKQPSFDMNAFVLMGRQVKENWAIFSWDERKAAILHLVNAYELQVSVDGKGNVFIVHDKRQAI